MPELIDLQNSTSPRDVIHRAVACLAEGAVVGLPTDSVYMMVAHGLQEQPVEKLENMRSSGRTTVVALCLKGIGEALDYVPEMGTLARRLASRCWPGPVTLSLPVVHQTGLLQALPHNTLKAVSSQDEVRIIVPTGEVVREIQQLLPAPLVVCSEVQPQDEMTSAAALQEHYGEAASLIVDAGPTRYGQSPTVVRIKNDAWEIVHPGIVAESTLKLLASHMYLFVCTGNTCRSPMAEALFRKILAEKLQCSEDELGDRGYVAVSAGLAAAAGAPASSDSVAVFDEAGIDLREHTSRPLTDRLLEQIDVIYTMTQNHRDSILAIRPEFADRVQLLSREGTDISDPFGGVRRDYELCKEEIERNIKQIVDEICSDNAE